jgi:hypothetical protein
MQTTEVTQEQWEGIMSSNPSKFKGRSNPVEQVSWDDIQVFLKALNDREGCGGCYRLPTEAEWEYAYRAGSTSTYTRAGRGIRPVRNVFSRFCAPTVQIGDGINVRDGAHAPSRPRFRARSANRTRSARTCSHAGAWEPDGRGVGASNPCFICVNSRSFADKSSSWPAPPRHRAREITRP